MRRDLAICAGLLCLTLAAFWQAGGLGFVNYDDPDYVYQNSHVRGGLTPANIAWAFSAREASNWHPLTWLSHMLDVQRFGVNAGPHHRTNLGFHIANTLLVFLVLRRMTAGRRPKTPRSTDYGPRTTSADTTWRCAFVAALFAVHPLHVESVAWISERKDVLSTFFGLLCLAAYVRYTQVCSPFPLPPSAFTLPTSVLPPPTSHLPRSPALLWYSLTFLLLALSLLAKPMLVTLPFVFLLLDYWPLERIAGGPAVGRRLLRVFTEKLPFLALSAASSVVTYIAQQQGGAMGLMEIIPPGQRIENATLAYVAYLGKMLWPVDLAVLYPLPRANTPAHVVAAAGLLALVSGAVLWAAWRGRAWLAVGWFWYLGTLVPVIGLIQVGEQALADRYTYLPMLGILIMAAWGAGDLNVTGTLRVPNRRHTECAGHILLAATATLAVAACVVLTTGQVAVWRNTETLFRHALAVNDQNALAHNNLGLDLAEQDRVDEAIYHYEQALRVRPRYAAAHNNLGLILAEHGQIAAAAEHYADALAANPDYAKAHNNLGLLLAGQGDTVAGIVEYREALRIQPDYAKAHNNLGLALAAQGDLNDAIAHYREAVRLVPDYAKAHRNLGMALARGGWAEEAAVHLQEALRLRPDDPATRRALDALRGPAAGEP